MELFLIHLPVIADLLFQLCILLLIHLLFKEIKQVNNKLDLLSQKDNNIVKPKSIKTRKK